MCNVIRHSKSIPATLGQKNNLKQGSVFAIHEGTFSILNPYSFDCDE